MANYVQTTFFTPKDTLPTTDPNKTIFGAAYDVEFGNIATAIASKFDNTSTPTFAGAVTAPAFIPNGSTLPVNGLYLPSANTIGLSANSTALGTFATGGIVFGGATGGAKGAGTINAVGLFVNGTAVGTSANPSATIGLTAVNGTATTFMTSDSAPPLSQAIVPTWSALHTFTGGLVVGVPTGGSKGANTINSPIANTYLDGTVFQGISPTWTGTHTFTPAITVNTGGSSIKGGLIVTAPAAATATLQVQFLTGSTCNLLLTGSSSGDGRTVIMFDAPLTTDQQYTLGIDPNGGATKAFALRDITNNKVRLNLVQSLTTAVNFQGWGPNAAALVDLTPDTASYTGTLTTCTTAPTVTITVRRVGNVGIITIPAITAVSNSVSTPQLTGALPASFQPATTQNCPIFVEDNGAIVGGYITVTAASSALSLLRADGAAFQAVGSKGIPQTTTFCYQIA